MAPAILSETSLEHWPDDELTFSSQIIPYCGVPDPESTFLNDGGCEISLLIKTFVEFTRNLSLAHQLNSNPNLVTYLQFFQKSHTSIFHF